jgi:anti-sigma-K factor RskA
MTDIENVHDDVEAYVLGALDEDDRVAFAQHLEGCPSCARETASYVPVLRALRDVAPPAAPPLRSPSKTAKTAAWRPRALYPIAAAVILGVGAIGGAGFHHMISSDMMTVAEMGTSSAQDIPLSGAGVSGRAIVGLERHRTAFVVAGLPPPGADRDYQVWVTSGATSSPGVLHRSMQGFEVLIVQGDALHEARTITITLEPSGGAKTMSGKPLISGATKPV